MDLARAETVVAGIRISPERACSIASPYLITTCHYIGDASLHTQPTLIAIVGLGESLNNLAFALVFVCLGSLAVSYGAWRVSQSAPSAPAV